MRRHIGFTLIELIISIVILGIIAGVISVIIARPIQGYVDATRRAQLTDMADLTLKRMVLELRTAIPNSVQPVGNSVSNYIEFIPTVDAGRYCSDTDTCTNKLTHFGSGSSTAIQFDVLGPAPSGLNNGDQLIIYNTGQDGLNAYDDDNCATLTSTSPSSLLGFTDSPFPFPSPSNRFFVAPASGPVRFSCPAGTGTITRTRGSTDFCGLTLTPTSSSTTLASAETVVCEFSYNQTSAANGLVTLQLTLGNAGESVTLTSQFHVDNIP